MAETTTPRRTDNVWQFKRVASGRPSDEIVAQIRARLASQVVRVGDKLPSERELEQQFQVSRNSIRQALKSLANMGLLEMRKGVSGGAFVISGGSDMVGLAFSDLFNLGTINPGDLTEVRVLLGVEVARLACLRASDQEIDALEANIVAAEAAVRSDNTALRTEINLEFHRMLARMSHNPLLVTLTNAVMVVTAQVSKGMVPMSDRSVMPLRRRLLAHLHARDAAAAAEEMREHLLRVQRHYLKHAGSGPGAAAAAASRSRAAAD